MVPSATYMIVGDDFLNGLVQLLNVIVELRHVFLEQGMLHGHERILALDDVASVSHHVICVINMQLAAAEVIGLKTSFGLCHNCYR